MVLGGLQQDGIAISIHHDHDVLVALFVSGGELTGLIGKHCIANVIDFSVEVAHLFASQCCCVCFLQRICLGLGTPYIFTGLIQITFWCLSSLWIIIDDIAFIEHRPTCEVSGLDCLDPCGFDWIATHCVHPFDCFFCCGQILDAVGLL